MNDLKITEYKDVRVLTTQQIAEAYGTDTNVITKNFNRNKERYAEGKHFIILSGDEKNDFVNRGQFDPSLKKASKLYLWTEKGAFLHAKSLGTDEAWEVYERLVDFYFNKKKPEVPTSTAGQIQLLAQGYTDLEKKIDRIENDMPLFGAESDELSAHVKRRGVSILGGKTSEAYKDKTLRKKVYSDIYGQLKREFGLFDDDGRTKSYKALKRRDLADAHEFVDCYELPRFLEEEIRDCNAQIRMEVSA